MIPRSLTRSFVFVFVAVSFLLCCVFIGSSTANTYMITDRSAVDSWVDEGNPASTAGSSCAMLYLTNSGADYSAGGSAWTICPVWQWNLDLGESESIQSITSATVKLTTFFGLPAGTKVRFYRLTAPFSENTVCWDNRPLRDESTYVEWTWPGNFTTAQIDVSPLLARNGILRTFGIEASAILPRDTSWAGLWFCYSNDDSYWGTSTCRLDATYAAHGPDELALTNNVRRGQNLPVAFTCTPDYPGLYDGIQDDTGFTDDIATVTYQFSMPVVVNRVKVQYYNEGTYNGSKEVSACLLNNGTVVATSSTVPANLDCSMNELSDTQGNLSKGKEAICYFSSPSSATTVTVTIKKEPGEYQSCIREIEIWGLPSNVSGTIRYIPFFTVTCNTPGSCKVSWGKPPAGTSYVRVRYRMNGTSDWSNICFGPNSTYGIVSGLVPGTKYDVTVEALGTSTGGTSTINTVYITNTLEVLKVQDTFGMNFYPNQGEHPNQTQNNLSMLSLMQAANVKHVRYYAASTGSSKLFADYGMDLMGCAIQSDWYGNKDAGMWLAQSGGEPDYNNITSTQFADAFRPLHKAMRGVSPQMVYTLPDVGGELYGPGGEYIDQLYNLLTPALIDSVDIHPYPKYTGVAPVGGIPASPETIIAGMASLKSVMAAHGDSNKPIVVGEVGHTTNSGYASQSTPEQQAQYIVRDMLLLIQSGVKRIYLYAFQDAGTDTSNPEHGFGMVYWDGTPKPAYNAYKYMTGLLGPTVLDGAQSDLSSPVYGVRFKKSNNTYITALWDCGGTSNLVCNWTGVTAITDLYGNAVTIPAQGQPLSLTESVVYVASTSPLSVVAQTRVSPEIVPQMQMTLSPYIATADAGSNATFTATVWHNYPTSRQMQVLVTSPFTTATISSSIFTVQPNTQQTITMTVPIPKTAATKIWSWDARCQCRENTWSSWSTPVYRALFFQVTARPDPVPIADVKKSADGTKVSFNGIVSGVFSNYFYIETVDRVSGIRVDKTNSGLAQGQFVYVFGSLGTLASGERYISPLDVAVN